MSHGARSEMADAAVAAWHRDGTKGDDSLQETDAERTVRQRAGTLALIGAAIERLGRSHTIDTIVVDLDAWFIGRALEAADEHGHIVGPPADRPGATPRFITVDLDVLAAPEQSLGILIEAPTESGTIQNRSEDDGGEFMSFALGEPHESIEGNIAAIATVIGDLDVAERDEWDRAASRVFNVGIEAGSEPNQPVITLDAGVVAIAASHGAGITVTHYPCHDRNALVSHTTIS